MAAIESLDVGLAFDLGSLFKVPAEVTSLMEEVKDLLAKAEELLAIKGSLDTKNKLLKVAKNVRQRVGLATDSGQSPSNGASTSSKLQRLA